MTGYTDTILKYASATSHVGLLDNPDGTGEVGLGRNEVGKRLAVRFSLKLNGDAVDKVRFQVFGCGFTIAACAAAAELSEGHPLQEVEKLTPAQIDYLLGGLPHERDYCAELAHQALKAALASLQQGQTAISSRIDPLAGQQQNPLLDPEDGTLLALLETPRPFGYDEEDRQMFAGLLVLAGREQQPTHQALGLGEEDLIELVDSYFPGFDPARLEQPAVQATPPGNPEVLKILLGHVPCDSTGGRNLSAEWLARSIAARASRPGHLWVSMGFIERPQLSAAIRRHLPTLALANSDNMRWKRFLFKQVCKLNGGVMCKNPNCGDCSDYALCFPPEGE